MKPPVFSPFHSKLMKSPRLLLILGLALLGGLFASGCATAPRSTSYNLTFELAPSLASTAVQVDLIGANTLSDLPKWQTISVTSYWQPDNVQRRDADKASLNFGPGEKAVQTFSSTDKVWSRWLSTGAMYLVVLVDLPGIATDRDGNADSRRLIIPLDVKKWPSGVTELKLQIQQSGVRLLTPMKAP